jgi:hypothetical protein
MAGETTYANGYTGRAFKGDGPQLCVLDVTHEVTTAELQLADKIIYGRIPKGAIYVDAYIASDDVDSATGVTFDLGDTADPDGLIDGTNVGQAGGLARATTGNYMINRHQTTEERDLILTVATAAATPVAGTVRVVVMYYVP